MTNERPTLYTGIANDLRKRVFQHKNELVEGFTKRYHIHNLVSFEVFDTAIKAIVREKQIKDMNRRDKLDLIRKENPEFKDLYGEILG